MDTGVQCKCKKSNWLKYSNTNITVFIKGDYFATYNKKMEQHTSPH